MRYVCVLLVSLVCTATASASVREHDPTLVAPPFQVITVHNEAGLSPRALHQAEDAVSDQVAAARQWWGIPEIRFGPGGWPVTIVRPGKLPAMCGSEADGCHAATDTTPYAFVTRANYSEPWTMIFSHEVLEMLVDPWGTLFDSAGDLVEICDPIEQWTYLYDHVWLSDFALPEAFLPDPHGRVDYMNQMSAADMKAELASG